MHTREFSLAREFSEHQRPNRRAAAAADAPTGTQLRCGSNFAGRHTLQNEHKFGSFYCEFRGTYTPNTVKKANARVEIYSEISQFGVNIAVLSGLSPGGVHKQKDW